MRPYGSTDAPSPGRIPSEMVDRRGPIISEDVSRHALALQAVIDRIQRRSQPPPTLGGTPEPPEHCASHGPRSLAIGGGSAATSPGLGGRNLEMRDRGLTIDEVLVILGVEHGGLDVGSREPDDGSP